MIVGDTPYLPESQEVNPFLTNTAFAAELVGVGGAYHFKRKVTRLGKDYDTAVKLANTKYRGTPSTRKAASGPTAVGRSEIQMGTAKQNALRDATKIKAQRKSIISKARKFKSAAGALGWGSVFALGMELGEGLFNVGTSYHSAQRAKRLATNNSTNESMYYDTRIAATMRQRALQVIHNSQLSTRAAFGQEASYLHW